MENRQAPLRMHVARISLLALGLLVYARTLGGVYLSWDDIQHFQFNRALQAGDWRAFWLAPYYGLYIPVIYTAWTWIHLIGDSPMYLHAFNLGLHLCNANFVYLIAHRRLPSATAALLASAIFLLHPVQVEPVAWIAGGRDLLSSFFGLLALCLLDRSRRGPATVSFVLGLLAKPSLALLPVAIFFLPKAPKLGLWRWIWLAFSAAALGYTRFLQAPFTSLRIEEPSWWTRPWIAFDAIGFYATKLAWPFYLSADYGRTPSLVLGTPMFALGVLGLIILLICVWRRQLFALTLLLPVLGLVPFEAQVQSTVFDRYLYLPMVGFALFVATHLRLKWIGIPLILLVSVLSFARTEVWLTNRALFENILAQNPRSYFAHVNLGLAQLQDNQISLAEQNLRRARDLEPRLALAFANLMHVYWIERNLTDIFKEGEPLLLNPEFLRFNQHEPQALSLLYRMVARARSSLLRRPGAEDFYRRALAYEPDNKDLQNEFNIFLGSGR